MSYTLSCLLDFGMYRHYIARRYHHTVYIWIDLFRFEPTQSDIRDRHHIRIFVRTAYRTSRGHIPYSRLGPPHFDIARWHNSYILFCSVRFDTVQSGMTCTFARFVGLHKVLPDILYTHTTCTTPTDNTHTSTRLVFYICPMYRLDMCRNPTRG